MNIKKVSLLIVLLLAADQALKIWEKTHLQINEAIIVFPDWFQIRFIENSGAAFGMRIASAGAFDWGKLLLGFFRIGLAAADRSSAPQPQRYAQRGYRRAGLDLRRRRGQHPRQRILWIAFLGIDAL